MHTNPVHSSTADKYPRLLNAKEAAEQMGVSRDTIWDWCQNKRLRHRKIGRMTRIHPRDLEEFEARVTVEPHC